MNPEVGRGRPQGDEEQDRSVGFGGCESAGFFWGWRYSCLGAIQGGAIAGPLLYPVQYSLVANWLCVQTQQ